MICSLTLVKYLLLVKYLPIDEYFIFKGVPIGTFIVDVNATDKDSSNNAELVYSIVHGSHGHFSVDANTGVVRTAVKLDYETIVHYTVSLYLVSFYIVKTHFHSRKIPTNRIFSENIIVKS